MGKRLTQGACARFQRKFSFRQSSSCITIHALQRATQVVLGGPLSLQAMALAACVAFSALMDTWVGFYDAGTVPHSEEAAATEPKKTHFRWKDRRKAM